jgi:hypothetical protein
MLKHWPKGLQKLASQIGWYPSLFVSALGAKNTRAIKVQHLLVSSLGHIENNFFFYISALTQLLV